MLAQVHSNSTRGDLVYPEHFFNYAFRTGYMLLKYVSENIEVIVKKQIATIYKQEDMRFSIIALMYSSGSA